MFLGVGAIFSVYKVSKWKFDSKKTNDFIKDIETNFASDDTYLKFLNTILYRSIYDFQVNLSSSDKVLTLSTCYSDTERTVVHARLIKRNVKM